jgi:threonine aldolase
MIDLRSDTATLPTPQMRSAMAHAVVGDEQLREDPTVNELQDRVAALLGHEAALFVPTATMANQIALRLLGRRGGEVIAQERSHVLVYEAGGAAVNSGLVMRGLPGATGRITPEQLRETVEAADWLQPSSVLSLENTHRSAGGRVWPLEAYDQLVATARDLQLGVHLDGARIFNAQVASGVPAARFGERADTVTLCFSKGLGCPFGAVLASSAERIEEAWHGKFLFGGALRQAGIAAAAALYALDHNVERLADDHARARRLAEGLAAAGLPVEPAICESNFVALELAPLRLDKTEALARLEQAGVLLSGLRPGVLRAVTHLGIDDDAIDGALDRIPAALGARVGV